MTGPVDWTAGAAADLDGLLRRAGRREAVGLMLGTCAGPSVRVDAVAPLRNRARGPHRFAVREAELAASLQTHGARVVGTVHSHAAVPTPSLHDASLFARLPESAVHAIAVRTEGGTDLHHYRSLGRLSLPTPPQP